MHGVGGRGERRVGVGQIKAHGNPYSSLKRHEYNVKQHDYTVKRHDYNVQQHEYNVKQHDFNVKRHDCNVRVILTTF